MIKFWIVLLFLFSSSEFISAQSFSILEDETTLIKTIEQSPAHWYIEVTANQSVDTTLRWKVHFDNVPTEWTISFDDQNNYYPSINELDSADFTLYGDPSFPQKLIIGAATNNTPATATVWFEIYNPLAPNIDTDTIYYHFIISDVNELNELTSFWENFKRIDDRLEVINQDLIGYSYSIYSLEGDEIETGIVDVTIPVNNVSDFILIDKDGVLISYRLPKSD